MPRTRFQPAGETGHYHTHLGVNRDFPGEQRIRLLGPFAFAYNTGGIFDFAGVVLAPIEAGTLVLKAWAIPTERFQDASPAEFDVKLMLWAGNEDGGSVIRLDNDFGSRDPATTINQGARADLQVNAAGIVDAIVQIPVAGLSFRASMQNFGDALTQGEAHAYALITETA